MISSLFRLSCCCSHVLMKKTELRLLLQDLPLVALLLIWHGSAHQGVPRTSSFRQSTLLAGQEWVWRWRCFCLTFLLSNWFLCASLSIQLLVIFFLQFQLARSTARVTSCALTEDGDAEAESNDFQLFDFVSLSRDFFRVASLTSEMYICSSVMAVSVSFYESQDLPSHA